MVYPLRTKLQPILKILLLKFLSIFKNLNQHRSYRPTDLLQLLLLNGEYAYVCRVCWDANETVWSLVVRDTFDKCKNTHP